jgi:hypothetical protein
MPVTILTLNSTARRVWRITRRARLIHLDDDAVAASVQSVLRLGRCGGRGNRVRGSGGHANAAARVVVQDAQGGSVEVVELSAARGPDVGDHGRGDDDEGEREDDEDHAHAVNLPRHELRMTVSELAGIMIAAMSGEMVPVMASAAPATL